MLSDLKEFNLHTYKPNLKNFRNFLVISCLFKRVCSGIEDVVQVREHLPTKLMDLGSTPEQEQQKFKVILEFEDNLSYPVSEKNL